VAEVRGADDAVAVARRAVRVPVRQGGRTWTKEREKQTSRERRSSCRRGLLVKVADAAAAGDPGGAAAATEPAPPARAQPIRTRLSKRRSMWKASR
jgi:hypothetical protein